MSTIYFDPLCPPPLQGWVIIMSTSSYGGVAHNRNVSLTVASMNGVVVLNVLSRMAVGISNIAISSSNSLGYAIALLLWLSIEQ